LKFVRFPRNVPTLGIALTLALTVALWPAARARVGAQNNPPPPPVPGVTPTASSPASAIPSGAGIPSLAPSPQGRRGHRSHPADTSTPTPEPSATPTSPAFATLDGTWELQLQYQDRTDYSYLVVAQKDTTISGVWRISKSVQYPFEGTYDGRLIRMLIKKPDGTVTMSGYVEGASDMVGVLDTGNGQAVPTAFTAEHRASQKGSPFKKINTY